MSQLLADNRPPVVRAQPRLGVGDQPVEEPHVDEVEELREELDGQRRVDPAAPQQRHGSRERVQDVICAETRDGSKSLVKTGTARRGRHGKKGTWSLLRHQSLQMGGGRQV